MREITLNLLRSVFCQTASLHHHLLFNLWQPVNSLCNKIITVYLKHGVMCIFTKPYAKLHFLGLEIQCIPPAHSLFIRFPQSLLFLCACLEDTEKGGAWLFLEEPRKRWRSNRLKLVYGEFWLDIREKNNYIQSGQTQEQINQGFCGISILGRVQDSSGHCLEQLECLDLSRSWTK